MSSNSRLTKTQLMEIRQVFDIFDKDGSGTINTREMKQVFKALEIEASENEIQKMINQMDQDGNGEVDFEEFVNIMGAQFYRKYTLEEIKAVFEYFDGDGNGSIEVKELKSAFSRLGKNFTDHQIEKMIKSVDKDGNGVISFDEFAELLKWNKFIFRGTFKKI